VKVHPYAELFPMIPDAELAELAKDIAEHGLREPVVMYQDMILDGRHRLRACEIANIEPRTVPYRGEDPLAYVISKNLHRRHLTESQRAMVAAKMANLEQGRPKNTAVEKPADLPVFPKQAEAAKQLNVGDRTVREAKKVLTDGTPALGKLVEAGEVSVNAAAEVAKLPAEEQEKIVEQGPKAVKETASKLRKKGTQNPSPPKPTSTDEVVEEKNNEADEPQEPAVELGWVKRMEIWAREIDKIVVMIEGDKLLEDPLSYCVPFQQIVGQLKSVRSTIWGSRPDFVCPYCDGTKQYKGRDCSGCKSKGMVPKHVHTSGRSAMNK
jgi:ParB-like chromosome segregation protein Spo0J